MSEKTCPSCGYCKECGRGGITYHPWGVVPYYPYQPYWWGTVTVNGNGISAANTPNQNGIPWTQAGGTGHLPTSNG